MVVEGSHGFAVLPPSLATDRASRLQQSSDADAGDAGWARGEKRDTFIARHAVAFIAIVKSGALANHESPHGARCAT